MRTQKERTSWHGDSQLQRGDKEDGEDGAEEEEEEVEEEFTMEIMLRMAGVDEKLIGWDRELDNFIKE